MKSPKPNRLRLDEIESFTLCMESKIFERSSALKPHPVSEMATRTEYGSSGSTSARAFTSPPSGVSFTALSMRFMRIWRTRLQTLEPDAIQANCQIEDLVSGELLIGGSRTEIESVGAFVGFLLSLLDDHGESLSEVEARDIDRRIRVASDALNLCSQAVRDPQSGEGAVVLDTQKDDSASGIGEGDHGPVQFLDRALELLEDTLSLGDSLQ